ncbi:ROK family transcriptional regulator [Curtobacterium sp. ISL-83]|uniref:ROK family transcriptional regulator n=1 Tax=Curtobacterium sp. ISL-83 TaxID=2819145 RepID=UPI002034F746|nr:ROK family transcriptional regulator [Curtobacterium sp. ISL-83]
MTQVELAGATGLSPATVSNIVKELVASGTLHSAPSTYSGRRALKVTLPHGLGMVVGVHVSPRHLRVAVSDLNMTVLAERHMPLARDHRADSELDKIAVLITDMLETVDSDLSEVMSIGFAIAAPMDATTGMTARAGIMRGWDGLRIGASLQERVQRPVHVDNSANLSAVAELRSGAARGCRNAVILDIGDGIGAGLVLEGRLFRGSHGIAGEFGHAAVMQDGPRCRCGSRGCLEAVAGAPAVLARIRDEVGSMKLGDLILRGMSGDNTCIRAIADAGHVIGTAAGGLCNVLDPDRVVVTGEFARAGELLLGPMRRAIEAGLIVDVAGEPDIVQGQLGQDAAVSGALALAIESVEIPATA